MNPIHDASPALARDSRPGDRVALRTWTFARAPVLAACMRSLAPCVAGVLALGSLPARAEAVAHARPLRITGVTLQRATAEGAELRVEGSGALTSSVFRLSNPTRIVLDIEGADISGIAAPSIPAEGLFSAVTTTQFEGSQGHVARVVAVLRADVEHQLHQREHGVTLEVRARSTEAPSPAAPPQSLGATRAPAGSSPLRSEAGALVSEVNATSVIELQGDGAGGASSAGVAASALRLLGIDSRERGGGGVVRIATDGAIARYEVEEVENPARLVIDLFDVSTERDAKKRLSVPGLRRVRVGKHPGRTRIVLDGKHGTLPRYDVAATAEGLVVVFDAPARAASRKAAVDRLRLTAAGVEAKAGFHRVSLRIGGNATLRTLKDAPTEKVVLLEGVRAEDAVLGTQDVTDGPMESIQVTQGKRGAEVRLRLHEVVEHSVWQKGGSVFWDVRPRAAASVAQGPDAARPQPRAAAHASTLAPLALEGAAARTFVGKKITLDLMDAEIVNVLRLIGDVSGKNVVVGDDVKGKVSIKLKDVPWDQALDVILRTKGLDQEVRGGIIRVAPKALLDKERDARLQLEEDRRKKIPTTVRLVPVNYAVASELTPQIKELLSERGRVTFDERTNVIIVEDITDNLEQAERLVRTLDTQTPQVLIEARMVEASTTFTRALGIQWGGGLLFSERTGNPTGLVFPNNLGIVGGADTQLQLTQPTPGVLAPSNFAVNLPADDITSGVGLNLGSVGNYGFLNARLTAAESSGMAKTISSPKITTLNNKTARIFQGQDLLITTVTQNQLNTNQIQARLDLEVTPHVTADGSVLMKVVLSNNQPNFQQTSGGNATINTKGAETELLVKDGDTAVIGGIYTRNFGEEFNETPFLGKIPLLGWLFKSYSSRDERNEMLVFLTPRIINRRNVLSSGR